MLCGPNRPRRGASWRASIRSPQRRSGRGGTMKDRCWWARCSPERVSRTARAACWWPRGPTAPPTLSRSCSLLRHSPAPSWAIVTRRWPSSSATSPRIPPMRSNGGATSHGGGGTCETTRGFPVSSERSVERAHVLRPDRREGRLCCAHATGGRQRECSMQRWSLCFIAAAMAVLACQSDAPVGSRSTRPAADISDGNHPANCATPINTCVPSNPHFYFLPPMVKTPSFSGTFNPSLVPTVTICALVPDGSVACDPTQPVVNPGPVQVDVADQQYQVNWQTDPT